MNIKTPEQIAREITLPLSFFRLPVGEQLEASAVAAIEADRAQRTEPVETPAVETPAVLPPRPQWDEENGWIDLPLVDDLINDVLTHWGIGVQDYSDPDWHTQIVGQIGPGEAVEYEELYSLMRDLVWAALNSTKEA